MEIIVPCDTCIVLDGDLSDSFLGALFLDYVKAVTSEAKGSSKMHGVWLAAMPPRAVSSEVTST